MACILNELRTTGHIPDLRSRASKYARANNRLYEPSRPHLWVCHPYLKCCGFACLILTRPSMFHCLRHPVPGCPVPTRFRSPKFGSFKFYATTCQGGITSQRVSRNRAYLHPIIAAFRTFKFQPRIVLDLFKPSDTTLFWERYSVADLSTKMAPVGSTLLNKVRSFCHNVPLGPMLTSFMNSWIITFVPYSSFD